MSLFDSLGEEGPGGLKIWQLALAGGVGIAALYYLMHRGGTGTAASTAAGQGQPYVLLTPGVGNLGENGGNGYYPGPSGSPVSNPNPGPPPGSTGGGSGTPAPGDPGSPYLSPGVLGYTQGLTPGSPGFGVPAPAGGGFTSLAGLPLSLPNGTKAILQPGSGFYIVNNGQEVEVAPNTPGALQYGPAPVYNPPASNPPPAQPPLVTGTNNTGVAIPPAQPGPGNTYGGTINPYGIPPDATIGLGAPGQFVPAIANPNPGNWSVPSVFSSPSAWSGLRWP